MAEKMNDFLKKYYKQVHFNSMPPEVRARFDKWVKAGTITDEMRLWADEFLEKDANGHFVPEQNNNKLYRRKRMLNPSLTGNDADIINSELEELFKVFQNAFTKMYAARSSFKDTNSQAYEFLINNYSTSEYDNKLFHMPRAKNETVNAINAILNGNCGLTDPSGRNVPLLESKTIQKYIVSNTQKPSGDGKYFDSIEDFNNFLGKVKQGKYQTDFKVRDQLCQVIDVLKGATSFYSSMPKDSDEYAAINHFSTEFDTISENDAFEDAAVTQSNLNRFRNGEAKRLLDELYEYENVFKEFSKHDDGKISKHITKGKDNAKWHDPKDPNYVKPITDDNPNLVQQIEKWAKDTYKDCFRKYEQLRGDRLFFKNESKAIFKAIDKNEIKPTDGLKGLLDKEKDIAKGIEDPLSKQHFEWFVKTMGEISNDYPLASAGCWKNASQMKTVIDALIVRAVRDSKSDIHAIDKAKTAMEIMTTMKYGMLTSKTMDALKKENLTIFSDKDLSWNKNKAVQFVTNAFDKSLKWAFMTIGYGITFVGNEIRLSNSKFKQYGDPHAVEAENNRINAERTRHEQERDTFIQNARTDIQTTRGNLATLNTAGYNDATIAQRENERTAAKARMDQLQNTYDQYGQQETLRDEYQNRATTINTKRMELATNITRLRDLNAYLIRPDLGTGRNMPDAAMNALAQQMLQRRQQLTQQISDARAELQDLVQTQNAQTTNYNDALAFINAHATEKQEYEAQQTRYEDLDSHIKQYHEATKKIEENNRAIAEKQAEFNTWNSQQTNVYDDLYDFWNFMQTGQHIAHTGRTSRRQATYDRTKINAFAQFKQRHGMAA